MLLHAMKECYVILLTAACKIKAVLYKGDRRLPSVQNCTEGEHGTYPGGYAGREMQRCKISSAGLQAIKCKRENDAHIDIVRV